MRKMYMEEAPDMRRVKEPRAIIAVLVFAVVFMVGFGIWHAPLLEFASLAAPNLASSITQGSTIPADGGGTNSSVFELTSNMTQASMMISGGIGRSN